MPAAFPLLDLATILLFAVMFALALTVKTWLHAIFQVVDKLVGWVPLVGNWIKAGENHVLSALNVLVVKSREGMSACISGLRWSLREFETGVREFSDAVNGEWAQLVNHALPTALRNLHDTLASATAAVDKRVDGLAGQVAGVGPAIRKAASDAETRAVNAAGDYTDGIRSALHDWVVSHVHGVYTEVESDIGSALHDAKAYTDDAVAGLRRAEDAAITSAALAAQSALDTAKRDLAAGIAAVSGALTTARQVLEGELQSTAGVIESELSSTATELVRQIGAAESAAEAAASSALGAEAHTLEAAVADARTAASAALDAAKTTLEGAVSAATAAAAGDLHAVAQALTGTISTVSGHVDVIASQLAAAEATAAGELADIYNLPADALRDLLDRLDLTKVASFGAGLVLVRGLVEALTREAGLDNAECRAKTKQICATPGAEWGDLLAGAGFLAGALSLSELIVPARVAVHELADVIAQAA